MSLKTNDSNTSPPFEVEVFDFDFVVTLLIVMFVTIMDIFPSHLQSVLKDKVNSSSRKSLVNRSNEVVGEVVAENQHLAPEELEMRVMMEMRVMNHDS